jgi:ABC-type oligopeptide transport system ATPase subunit
MSDISVQATVPALFRGLRKEFGLTYLFISHDLAVARSIPDRVVVMCLDRIVEIGSAADVFGAPHHPYTRSLLAAAPRIDACATVDPPAEFEGGHGVACLRWREQAV